MSRSQRSQSSIPLPVRHPTLQAASASTPSLPTPQQVAPRNRPGSMQSPAASRRVSSLGQTVMNTNTPPIAEAGPSTAGPVREGNRGGQSMTTFRNMDTADVPNGVFVNTSGSVTFYHGDVPSRQPSNNEGNSAAEGTGVNISPTQDHSSTMAEHSEYEIYYKYLSVKQRGTPLWEPGPQMMLPTEYRRNGVRLGDVGVLDPTVGCFTFLFNIFLPANHEINEGRVPAGFVPLGLSRAQKWIKRSILYDRGSCLASSSLRLTGSSEFSFQTTSKEGAVLVMPAGAVADDLGNHKMVEIYIAANAKSWWEYVESEDCGVQNENVLQVVVGTDKVSSWGMATFENVEDSMQFELKDEVAGTESQSRTYKWKNIISGRAGPPDEEIQDLLSSPNVPLRNQCVFVRTLNVSVFDKVPDESAVQVYASSPTNLISDLGSAGRRTANPKTSKLGSPISHPSKLVNERVSAERPNAKVVITRDSVWISVIGEDATMPNVEEICTRVLDSHKICEENGVVTLEERKDRYVIGRLFRKAPDQFISGTLDDGRLSAINFDDSGSGFDRVDEFREPFDTKVDEHFSERSQDLQRLEEEKDRATEVVEPTLGSAYLSLSEYFYPTEDKLDPIEKKGQASEDQNSVVGTLIKLIRKVSQNLGHSSRSLTGNWNTRGQAPKLSSLEINNATNFSDGKTLNDEQFSSQKLPDLDLLMSTMSSWGGSRPSTASSTSHPLWRPPSSVKLNSIGDILHSPYEKSATSSSTHINWPSPSELPYRRHFGRPKRYLGLDSYWAGPRIHNQDRQPSFDGASRTSSRSSTSKTKASRLWSAAALLFSRRGRAKARKIDEVSSHALPMGSLLGDPAPSLNRERSASKRGKGKSWQTLRPSSRSVYQTPQRSHSDLKQTALDWEQGLSQLTSPQTSQIEPAQNDLFRYLSPIEQAIQSHLPTFHVVGGAVTSGTLEGLIQFLITGFSLPGHSHYRDTLLTACSELTTPGDLFQILSRRLDEERHTSDKGSSTQYTIFVFIVYWLKANSFSPNEELLYRIRYFSEEVIQHWPALDSIAKETLRLIDFKVTQPGWLRPSSPQIPVLEAPSITPRDLAVALCLLEGDNYKALQPSDYLQHLSKGRSDRVKLYNETTEKIKLWVTRSILNHDTVSGRSEVATFYINTALECYSMRNFSSTVAICSSLQSVSIESLTATMKAARKAARKALSKKMRRKLLTLYGILDPRSNHYGYYNALQGATVQERDRNTCIPWLAVHLKELDKVVRQPLTVLVNDQHLVNFARYNRFMERVKEVLYYSPPDFEDKRDGGQLDYLLKQLQDIDLSGELEQSILAKSRELAARESTE